jgi:hypothetical protein
MRGIIADREKPRDKKMRPSKIDAILCPHHLISGANIMQKWEYLVVFVTDSKTAQDDPEVDVYLDSDKYTQALNTYGDAGWELVSFESHETGAKAAFKRPKAEA